jgi:uncharacterized Zn-finger protein
MYCNISYRHIYTLVSNICTLSACLQKIVCTKPGCGKVFKNRNQLIPHMRWHKGDTKHKCHVTNCWMAFVSNQLLEDHFKTHTGEKPIECGICKKRFSRKRSLYRHMKIHTKNVSFIEESKVRI